jgi:hypothetical protein
VFLVLIVVLGYFLAGLVAVIVLARSLARREISLVWKIGAPLGLAFVVWAIPYGDHMLGKYEFERLCRAEAGTKVFQVVNNVDGFKSRLSSSKSPKEQGYKYVERVNSNGTVDRYSLSDDGVLKVESKVTSNTPYLVDQSTHMIGRQIIRVEDKISDSRKGKLLAVHVSFGHVGGWLSRQLEGMYVHRDLCPKDPLHYTEFVRSVLKSSR